MSDFQLAQRYDVVMCLFSSIGYLRTLDRVARALVCFRNHVVPGGAIVVEPWFEPGVLDPARVGRHVGETDVSASHAPAALKSRDGSRVCASTTSSQMRPEPARERDTRGGTLTNGELLQTFLRAGLKANTIPRD